MGFGEPEPPPYALTNVTDKHVYLTAGYEVVWAANPGACKVCRALDGQTVRTEKTNEGGDKAYFEPSAMASRARSDKFYYGRVFAPPAHRGCRCSIRPGKMIVDKMNGAEDGLHNDGDNDKIKIGLSQFGSKLSEHGRDWGLNPASSTDRDEFRRIIFDIVETADERRYVEWDKDPKTSRRSVEVIGYIKGSDVVLTEMNGYFITIMKNGIHNKRVAHGRRIEL